VFADIAIADPEHFRAPFHSSSLLLIEFLPSLQYMTEGRRLAPSFSIGRACSLPNDILLPRGPFSSPQPFDASPRKVGDPIEPRLRDLPTVDGGDDGLGSNFKAGRKLRLGLAVQGNQETVNDSTRFRAHARLAYFWLTENKF